MLKKLLKHAKQLVVIPSILVCISQSAGAAVHYSYGGVDIAYNHANVQPGYGQFLFNNNPATQYNVFFGHYLARLLGIEIGYQQTRSATSSAFVPAGVAQFGVANFTGIASNTYSSQKSWRGFSLSYVPQLLIKGRWSLIPLLGVTIIKTSNDLVLTEFDGAPATSLEQSDYYLYFVTTKAVPRIGLRLQYCWKRIGLRASYLWEQTSLLQPQATRNINPSQALTMKFKNCTTVGLGVLYKF